MRTICKEQQRLHVQRVDNSQGRSGDLEGGWENGKHNVILYILKYISICNYLNVYVLKTVFYEHDIKVFIVGVKDV